MSCAYAFGLMSSSLHVIVGEEMFRVKCRYPHRRAAKLAEAIRKRREEAHLSQAEMAELLGVSTRTIWGWEAGATRPLPRHRRALAAWLEDTA